MTNSRRNQQQLWLGISISIACALLILWWVDLSEVWFVLTTADYRYLLITIFCTILFLIFRAFRWHLLLQQQATWTQTFHIQNIGYMLTMLLPLRLGDVARVALIGAQPRVSIGQALSTMIVERVLDLLFFAILLPLTMALRQQFPPELQWAGGVAASLSMGGLLFLLIAANRPTWVHQLATAVFARIPILQKNSPFLLRQIEQLLLGLECLTRRRDAFLLLSWSIIVWLPILTSYYAIMQAVGLPVTAVETGFITSVAAFSVAAPSSPGQLGVFHASVTFAITVLGYPEATAVSFAIIYHLTNSLTMIFIGLLGLLGAGTTFRHVVALAQNSKP